MFIIIEFQDIELFQNNLTLSSNQIKNLFKQFFLFHPRPI